MTTHKEQTTKEQTYYTCDVCGKRVDHWGDITKCDGCGKDVCRECWTYSPREHYEDSGDYSYSACIPCRKEFYVSGFGKRMDEIASKREALYDEEENVWKSWREQCRGANGC